MAVPGLQGIRRKIVYVTLFELIAVAITSTGLAAGSSSSLQHARPCAVAASSAAPPTP